ncbi:Uncharacterised protein [uncultured archaeon]|nr:Uncharacterised protein [uncultured archaeon]
METLTKNVRAHSPTLQSVIMVEDTIKMHSGAFSRYQLWHKLPRGMMYQTFLVILDYLTEGNKIATDKEGKIAWIWNPELVNRLMSRKVLR